MDIVLVDAFLNEYNMGLKVNGTFISKAYDNVIEELVKNFNIKIRKKIRVKNRWKILKKHFLDAYVVFKNDMSGSTIDPITQVWNDLMKIIYIYIYFFNLG